MMRQGALAQSGEFMEVLQFHRAFGMQVADELTVPSWLVRKLRMDLIHEELAEFENEVMVQEPNLEAVAQELADLLYVVYGAAVEWGIPVDEVLAEVHAANMTKLWSLDEAQEYVKENHPEAVYTPVPGTDRARVVRKDGKILKPPSYVKPDVGRVLDGWFSGG